MVCNLTMSQQFIIFYTVIDNMDQKNKIKKNIIHVI